MSSSATSTLIDGPSTGRPRVSERVTVNLSEKASEALAEAGRITRDSKTDNINKALIIYAMLQQAQETGGAVYLREKGGELERLKLL